jgi:hypothetical protein
MARPEGAGNKRPLTTYTLAEANGRIDRFCDALREMPVVRHACEAAGISRQTAYTWRKKYKTFADKWDEALEDGIDQFEQAGWKRGRETSDRLLQFMLAAHRKEKYGTEARHKVDVQAEVSGEFVVRFAGRKVTDDD